MGLELTIPREGTETLYANCIYGSNDSLELTIPREGTETINSIMTIIFFVLELTIPREGTETN